MAIKILHTGDKASLDRCGQQHIIFPKDSESLKLLDIQLREVEAKRRLNGTSKVNKHTNRQTDTQTDISTYRKHPPDGRCFEKLENLKKHCKNMREKNKKCLFCNVCIQKLKLCKDSRKFCANMCPCAFIDLSC